MGLLTYGDLITNEGTLRPWPIKEIPAHKVAYMEDLAVLTNIAVLVLPSLVVAFPL